MFKPTVGGIWVPVGELSWGWSGIAESSDGGNSWTKTSGAHDTVDPDGSATTSFPEWSETATETNPDFIPD